MPSPVTEVGGPADEPAAGLAASPPVRAVPGVEDGGAAVGAGVSMPGWVAGVRTGDGVEEAASSVRPAFSGACALFEAVVEKPRNEKLGKALASRSTIPSTAAIALSHCSARSGPRRLLIGVGRALALRPEAGADCPAEAA